MSAVTIALLVGVGLGVVLCLAVGYACCVIAGRCDEEVENDGR